MTDEEKLATLGPEKTPDFCLSFNFPQNTRNPQRLFTAAGAYIEALQSLDALLVSSVDAKIKPVFVLEEIEVGSIRLWMKQLLEAVDDEALKNLDWKPAVGAFLVKGKYRLLKALEGKKQFPCREDFEAAAKDINALARETDVRRLPAYKPIKAIDLANESRKLGEALGGLEKDDFVAFSSDDGDVQIQPEFIITQEQISDLFIERRITNEIERILMVRKPDFLGDTKWEFHYEKRALLAKIGDTEWMEQYQSAQVDVRPGDALHVKFQESVTYDQTGEVIKKDFVITQVLGVIRVPEQASLL